MTPLTVVLTNDAADIAGGENYVLFVALGLRQRGHRVIIAPLEGSMLAEAARAQDFETREIPYASRGREFSVARRMVSALRDDHVDVIHSNSNLDRTIGALAARKLRCACVASVHSCLSIQHNITHWFRNRFLIHRFTPVGHSTQRVMTGKDRIPASRISVVHIGMPEEAVRFSAEGRRRVRAELGLSDDAVLIGNLARLVAFKGHTYLLSAMQRLLNAHPSARCAIAGDGELRDSLQSQVGALGLSAQVTLLGHRNDISDFLSACDIYAQPSVDFGGETFPVSVLNAMAAGRPIVASDVGDIRYMVLDGDNGFLTKDKQSRELADALSLLVADVSLREAMGKRSRALFLERFTLETMIANLEKVYHEVVKDVKGKKTRNETAGV